MIESFACRDTAALWEGKRSRRFPANIQARALPKLILLHSAPRLENLRIPPSDRLELLKGTLAGQYPIRINDQWRPCFRWNGNHATDAVITNALGIPASRLSELLAGRLRINAELAFAPVAGPAGGRCNLLAEYPN